MTRDTNKYTKQYKQYITERQQLQQSTLIYKLTSTNPNGCVSIQYWKDCHIFTKQFNLFLKAQVIFSIGIHLFITESHFVKEGNLISMSMQHIFLQGQRRFSVNLMLKLFLKFTFVKLPRRHIPGSSGKETSIIKGQGVTNIMPEGF